ncbi:MAG: hypothetical protein MHPSP_000565 [Paramarteilia canceri]
MAGNNRYLAAKQRKVLDKIIENSVENYTPQPEDEEIPDEKIIEDPSKLTTDNNKSRGSSWAANSSSFFVYRAQRRQESERLRKMEEDEKLETEQEILESKLKKANDIHEQKTKAKRLKRYYNFLPGFLLYTSCKYYKSLK